MCDIWFICDPVQVTDGFEGASDTINQTVMEHQPAECI